MRNKNFCALIFFVVLAFVSTLTAKETIKVGVILPLSGEYDWAGEATRNGMLLCLKEHPSTRFDYQLIYEDGALEAARSSLAAQKLANVDHVDVLISMWGTEAAAVAPISEQKNIPHIGNEWDMTLTNKSPHTICLTSPAENYGGLQIEMFKQWKTPRVAILHQNSTDWKPAYQAFSQAMKKETSLQLVADESFNSPLRDFRTVLLKIKETRPDVLLIWSIMPESEIILRQAKEMGVSTRMTGYFEDIGAKELAEGLSFVRVNDMTDKFKAEYKNSFHAHEDATGVAAQGHDQLEIVLRACERLDHKPSSQGFIESATHLTPWQGACGFIVPDGRKMVVGMRIVKYQNGQMIPDPDFAALNKKMGW